jgi:hypothetical protein
MKTIFVNVCAVVARLLAVFFILTASRVLAQEVAGDWGGFWLVNYISLSI